MSPRDKVQMFTECLAELIRANDTPAQVGQTTTGSAMIFTVYDGMAINITITSSRGPAPKRGY